jgi:hypothetical protein
MKSEYDILLKLVARAFYREGLDLCYVSEIPRSKMLKYETAGLIISTLDSLSRVDWIEENNLIANMRLNPRLQRVVIHFLEQEHFIMRVYVREKRPSTVIFDSSQILNRGGKVHSFVKIDYLSFVDSVQLRLHNTRSHLCCELARLRYTIKPKSAMTNKLELKKSESEVDCLNHSNFDNKTMLKPILYDANILVDQSTHLKQIKDMIRRFEHQLRPITNQLNRLNEFSAPNCGTFKSWFNKIAINNQRFSETFEKTSKISGAKSLQDVNHRKKQYIVGIKKKYKYTGLSMVEVTEIEEYNNLIQDINLKWESI